jgi:hypothetical protein
MPINIPDSLFDTYFENVDYFNNEAFGVDCILYYPAVKEICSNCIYNHITKTSTNIYKAGGPISFSNTICPYCHGEGAVETETETDTIKMRVYFDRKSWIKPPGQVELKIPDGSCQCYGFLVDLPKLKRADRVGIHAEVLGHDQFVFKLSGEPWLHGFKKNKYFICILERN